MAKQQSLFMNRCARDSRLSSTSSSRLWARALILTMAFLSASSF